MIFSKSRIMLNCLVTGLFVVILQYSTEASSIYRSKEVKNNRNTIPQNIVKPSRNTGITNNKKLRSQASGNIFNSGSVINFTSRKKEKQNSVHRLQESTGNVNESTGTGNVNLIKPSGFFRSREREMLEREMLPGLTPFINPQENMNLPKLPSFFGSTERTRGRSAATSPSISTPKKVNVIKPSESSASGSSIGSTENGMLPAPTPFTNTQKYTAQPQGIVGTVVSLMGDFMPKILPENTNNTIIGNSVIRPIATRIWIFEGKVKPTPMKNWPPEFAPAPISPRLPISEAMQLSNRIGWVMSDQNGQFQVGLPVGEYTILAEYEDDLYLNLFDGNGYFATVEVKPQQTTTVKLENTEKATW